MNTGIAILIRLPWVLLKLTLDILPFIRALFALYLEACNPGYLSVGIYAAAGRCSGIAWPRKRASRVRNRELSIPADRQTRGKSLLSSNRYCSASRWRRSGPEIHS